MSNEILAGLMSGAIYYVSKVKEVLAGGDYPTASPGNSDRGYVPIQDAMIIEPAQMMGENKAFVNVVVEMAFAPYAAAYEFGSGEHATAGPVGKYKIRPRNKRALLFPWQPINEDLARSSPKYIADTDGLVWMFKEVDHPGVPARPYLRPTVDKEVNKITELIGRGFESEMLMRIIGESGVREEKIVVTI